MKILGVYSSARVLACAAKVQSWSHDCLDKETEETAAAILARIESCASIASKEKDSSRKAGMVNDCKTMKNLLKTVCEGQDMGGGVILVDAEEIGECGAAWEKQWAGWCKPKASGKSTLEKIMGLWLKLTADEVAEFKERTGLK